MDRLDGAQQIISKQVEQCDPYSSFGVFCNTNGFIEGLVVIAGVILLVGAAVIFVKKNQDANAEKHREKYKKYIQ
ncbi:hypothetical protein GWK41_01295 [Persephonella atlantica]|uniref:Uncharacterized protein n=1 Tax=Persephonella atlantica TaxID=2699429 RepID=A0ABS1GFK4_9AQUI|nr:hypothetical protein [Persephonella atlantica]MBK3331698.1 hypothetical protein [Persephonella atlantica]